MRSISTKISLVLVVVSLAGELFAAFYLRYQTQKAFDRYIRNQDQQVLVEALTGHYQENNSWRDVDQVFREIYRSYTMRNSDSQPPDSERTLPLSVTWCLSY